MERSLVHVAVQRAACNRPKCRVRGCVCDRDQWWAVVKTVMNLRVP